MSHFFSAAINYRTDIERNFSVAASVETPIRTIADNNYNTYSDSNDYAFITHGILPTAETRITHVFIKGTGIVSYTISIPSGSGTGSTVTRTLPTTVDNLEGDPVPILVEGYQNDLFKLTTSGGADNPFNCTRVEISLTGTSPRLYEIMLLDLQYELQVGQDYFQINPRKVDRKAGLHTSTTGTVTRYSAANSHRNKWEIEYGVRFLQPYAYRPLLKFQENNDNFVFAQEYTRYPDRVFPAVLCNFVSNLEDKNHIIENIIETYFEIYES